MSSGYEGHSPVGTSRSQTAIGKMRQIPPRPEAIFMRRGMEIAFGKIINVLEKVELKFPI